MPLAANEASGCPTLSHKMKAFPHSFHESLKFLLGAAKASIQKYLCFYKNRWKAFKNIVFSTTLEARPLAAPRWNSKGLSVALMWISKTREPVILPVILKSSNAKLLCVLLSELNINAAFREEITQMSLLIRTELKKNAKNAHITLSLQIPIRPYYFNIAQIFTNTTSFRTDQ